MGPQDMVFPIIAGNAHEPLVWSIDAEDIAVCRLTESDVVRHVIVQRIIQAYEEDENRRKGKHRNEKS